MAMAMSAFTASSRSSKDLATTLESRSKPSASCVMSLEPIEKPSKYSRYWSASSALVGSSHIMMCFKSLSPRFRPFAASNCVTSLASLTVRTNGTMT